MHVIRVSSLLFIINFLFLLYYTPLNSKNAKNLQKLHETLHQGVEKLICSQILSKYRAMQINGHSGQTSKAEGITGTRANFINLLI